MKESSKNLVDLTEKEQKDLLLEDDTLDLPDGSGFISLPPVLNDEQYYRFCLETLKYSDLNKNREEIENYLKNFIPFEIKD